MLKGNFSLLEARKIIQDDIVSEIKKIWEHLKLVVEKKSAINTIELSILLVKEEDAKNCRTNKKFIKFLNEKLAEQLR